MSDCNQDQSPTKTKDTGYTDTLCLENIGNSPNILYSKVIRIFVPNVLE